MKECSNMVALLMLSGLAVSAEPLQMENADAVGNVATLSDGNAAVAAGTAVFRWV